MPWAYTTSQNNEAALLLGAHKIRKHLRQMPKLDACAMSLMSLRPCTTLLTQAFRDKSKILDPDSLLWCWISVLVYIHQHQTL